MRFEAMSDAELGAALAALGPRIDWPPTPDVGDDVIREIRAREARPRPLPRSGGRAWGRGLLIAAVLLIPVVGTAVAATLLWDLGGIRVEVVPPSSRPLPTETLDPTVLGRRVALKDAPDVAGFEPLVPPALGDPKEVYVSTSEDEAVFVVLAWHPRDDLPPIPGTRWGALLFQVRGDDALISKDVFAGSVEPAVVDGREAVWSTGEHPIRVDTAGGEPFLVTGNVLLWNEGAFAMRLESLLSRDDAIRLAGSVA